MERALLLVAAIWSFSTVACSSDHSGSGAGGSTSSGASGHGGGGASSSASSVTSSGPGSSGSVTSSASGSGGGSVKTYTTNFPLTENPISENGMWINGGKTGLDWHDVSTTPGLAIGHQSMTSYTDGTALLTGSWGPTQTVEAVVHTVNPKGQCYQEVEMRLRSALSSHSCTGYEISFKATKGADSYLIIVRWNGPLGSFDYLLNVSGSQYGISDGDMVKATIQGDVIRAYINNVQVGMASDSTFKTGNPGMGFNLETADPACIGTNGDYGFTAYSAEAF